jgi:hypothetical protein
VPAQSQKHRGIGNPGEPRRQAPERRVMISLNRRDDLLDEQLAGLRNGRRPGRGPTMVASTTQPFRIRPL